MAAGSLIETVRTYLRHVEARGIPVDFAVVFGSYATGKANSLSDIDLLVVSSHFDRTRSRADIDTLWHVAARVDSRIEPIACGLRQWSDDRSSAIIEIARREGQTVTAEGSRKG